MHSSLTAQSSKAPATINNLKRPFTRSQPLINLNYFSQLVGSQIRYLVTNLNKKNYKASVAEIHHLIDLYGHDAYLFLLRSLVSNIDFRDIKQKDQQRIQLLNQETVNLMKQPNFASCICQTLEGLESMQEDFITNFSKTLKLPLAQEILISVALVNSPDPNTKTEALKFLKSKLNELSPSVTKTIPENVLHSLLYVLRTEGLLKQAQTVMKALQKITPPSQVVAPLLAEGDPTVANSKEVYTKEAGKRQDALMQEIFNTYHISAMMEDIGYSCAETPASFRDILSQFPDLKEADVAQILGMMARTHSSLEGMGIPLYKDFPPTVDFSAEQKQDQAKSWNVNVVIDVLKESYPKLNWPLVVKSLDFPGFYVPDPKGLALIMGVYRKVSKEPFPLDFLFENWKNTSGQLSFLKLAVTAPPDMFNFSQSTRRIDAEGLPSVAKNAPALHQSWYSLSLIETLLRLAEVENYTIVRNIFNYPTKHCPELLCIGLAQAKTSWNALSSELSTLLLPNVLTLNNAASNYTIHKIWALNPSMLVKGMIELYQKDYASLSRILEIATQDLKALTPILETKPFGFTIELAALASRREFLNLDKWLQDKLLEHGNAFAKACIGYMKDKIARILKGEQSQRIVDTLAIFFTRLQNTSSYSNEVNEEVKALLPKFQAITKVTPPTVVETPPVASVPTPVEVPPTTTSPPPNPGAPKQQILGSAPPAPENTRVFPPEIEELSNAYFQKIYTGVLNIEEIVGILTRFKNSKEKREQDVFACMIHNLFDEYRFFPKYPDKELSITGVLFGSLIQHQLVSFLPLGVALRYVLDALRKQPGTKMFKFGLTALDQFKSRLPEWPQYCSHILAIPSIRKVVPEIVEFIEKNLPALPPATAPPSGPATSGMGLPGMQGPMPGMNAPPPQGGNNSNNVPAATGGPTPAPTKDAPTKEKLTPSEILQRGVSPPPKIDENIADKIAFVFNNVSLSNMDQKVVELKHMLKDEEITKYTSHYLITKRLSLEYNFHSLYQAVIDKLKLSRLSQLLLTNTLEAIYAFLKSDSITTSSEEKQALKNLGNWLGILTLSKNKPLLQKDLGLKELLFDAFENGKLIVVVPFVCKILENCATSKVFKPPNPWVMAIMRLLAEIYRLPNLRQSLKFEVEFICKALSVDLNELKPSDSLKDKRQYIGPNNFDFKPPPQAPSDIRTVSPKDLRPTSPRTESPTMEDMDNIGLSDMSGEMMPGMPDPFVQQLSSYLTISTGIPLFNQQPSLKRCVPIAMDRAIREILSPVVERSVTIACITTREMVMKDFATEPDENKMRKAAHLMVQNLAGSLALVTCKEPLRLSMNNHLKNLLQLQTPEQFHPLVEHAVQVVSADNLDLACTLIEKAATEKAVRDTDDALTAAFLSRKKHRERPGVVPPYFDINFTSGRYPSTLPETLRPKLGGLMSHQLRVYDDFSRIPHIQQQQQQQQQQQFPGQFSDKEMDRRSPTMFDQSQEALTTGQAVEKFNAILAEIDNICTRLLNPNLTLASLPPDNDIVKMLLQIPIIISQSMSRTEVALAFAQRIFKSLYENDAPLYLDIRFNVLDAIVSPNPKITKEITSWLLYLDDERKYHRQITPRLLRAQLLSAPDLDAYLVKMMDTARSKPALDFSIYLLRQISLDPRLAAVADFSGTVDLLTKLARSKGQDELLKLLDDVRAKTAKKEPAPTKLRTQAPTDFTDPPGIREEVVRILEEWVALYSQPNQSENILAAHVATMQQQQGVLKDEETSSRFFRLCTELVIENSGDKGNYTAVDAYSKMVVLLVKYSESPNTKIALLSRVLGVVVRVLMRDYESKKTKFNQRPYFRLFANWFVDLNVPDPTLDQISLQILLAFSNSFMMLSPLRLPGFSFAWLELISHRMFMPKLLLTKGQKGWPLFQRLLVELFKFLEPYLRNAELSDPIRMLYKGTLRVLLVLLHDFPEFLCDFHYSFCDIIPTSCIQMRNLILSAFPRNMRLPDPFTPNLKVDLLPEINQSPRILSNYAVALGHDLLSQLDNYLKNRSPVTFLLELKSRLLLGSNEAAQAGTKYNVSVINAIVLHVGMQAIAQLQNKSSQVPPSMTHSAPMDIFQHLALDLDTEGRYLFLNAIANQLRYPNNHTHYFSCVLLYLFAEASQEIIQEQITRVLLERLIVNRPHPWGLLITFIELIKNPRYSFWNHSFTRCAPEIERLFESVARSCMGPSQPKPQEE